MGKRGGSWPKKKGLRDEVPGGHREPARGAELQEADAVLVQEVGEAVASEQTGGARRAEREEEAPR